MTRRLGELIPVIHYSTCRTALDAAKLAKDCGCKGVMLINMAGDDDTLLNRLVAPIRDMGLKVGINRLLWMGRPAASIRENCHFGTDWTWGDYSGISSTQNNSRVVESIQAVLQGHPGHSFFGGVAFKYRVAEPNPAWAAVEATRVGMIPTTSGAATGSAPEVAKIRAMSEALGNRKLAIASGISPENVSEFLPYSSVFLVASSLLVPSSNHEFDQKKMAKLANIVHQELPEGAPDDGILL